MMLIAADVKRVLDDTPITCSIVKMALSEESKDRINAAIGVGKVRMTQGQSVGSRLTISTYSLRTSSSTAGSRTSCDYSPPLSLHQPLLTFRQLVTSATPGQTRSHR